MSPTESKPKKRQPLAVHFLHEDRLRLEALSVIKDRSMSNLAAQFIREGMEREELRMQGLKK